MDGKELLSRTVTTIQEMYLKIGDTEGIVSLYYPFEGDAENILEEFNEAKKDSFPDITAETLQNRLRVMVNERDCKRIASLPIKKTMADLTALVNDRKGIDDLRNLLNENYPDARLVQSRFIDFDWILLFPEGKDSDIYCITEELGQMTYHRFSPEEYMSFGYPDPRKIGS